MTGSTVSENCDLCMAGASDPKPIVEGFFDKRTTVRSKGCLSNRTALTMVFKLIEGAQKSWRRLDGHNQLPKLVLSYAGIWVTGRSGGDGFWQFDYFDSVLESDTSDDLRQLICAFQPSPGFRCGAN